MVNAVLSNNLNAEVSEYLYEALLGMYIGLS